MPPKKRGRTSIKKEPLDESSMSPKPKRRRSSAKQEAYEVSRIVQHKLEDNELLFEVHWVGYTDSTWEPVTSLQPGANEILHSYLQQTCSRTGPIEDLLRLLQKPVDSAKTDIPERISVMFMEPNSDLRQAIFKTAKPLGRVLRGFCVTVGLSYDDTTFFFNGKTIGDLDTASSLGIRELDTIEVRKLSKSSNEVDDSTMDEQLASPSVQHVVYTGEGSIQEKYRPGTPITPARLFGSTSAREAPKAIKQLLKFMSLGEQVLVLCECVDGTINQFTYSQLIKCWPMEFMAFMEKFILDRLEGSSMEA